MMVLRSLVALVAVMGGITLLHIAYPGKYSRNFTVLPPVVIIPGDGGNQLQARVDSTKSKVRFCSSDQDWYTIYVNSNFMTKLSDMCTVENMKLEYNIATKKTSSRPGVDIRVTEFGETDTMEILDPVFPSKTVYMKPVVDHLVKELNYVKGMNLRGAPYDWRKAPNEHERYFVELKELIEETYRLNLDSKVMLLAHSMGGLFGIHFLNNQTQVWKDKYIAGLLTVATPWAGTMKALKVLAAGDSFGHSIALNLEHVKQMLMTFPSTAYTLPRKPYWKPSDVIVQIPGRNYTVHDIDQLFLLFDVPDVSYIWEDTRNLTPIVHPGVKFYCVHGTGIKTIDKLVYDKEGNIPSYPELMWEKGLDTGDGTVNYRSLEACTKMADDKKGLKVHHREVSGMHGDHFYILGGDRFLSILRRTLRDLSERPKDR